MDKLLKENRKRRIRARIEGTAKRPRVAVARSLRFTGLQVIDDVKGITLAAADSRILPAGDVKGKTKTQQAQAVGVLVAAKVQELGVKQIVFDRGGYKYHGRVAALAAGLREGGLDF